MEEELYLIILLVVIQIAVFIAILYKMGKFRSSIPLKQNIRVESVKVLLGSEDDEIYIDNFFLKSEDPSMVFENIQDGINSYLKNNKGASADLGILKDIVDRDIERLENEITNLTPLPLYIGLMGTIVGIVIGLFQIPSVGDSSFLEGIGIDVLIDGVKYAMIASLMGILLTSVASGWFFRRAKFFVEGNYNDFLTLLETQLLPALKEDVSTNLTNLYQNLALFNASFSKNVRDLRGLMNKNYEALVTQDRILENLQNVDVNRLADANIKVFSQMEQLMPQFNMMNSYVKGINTTIKSSNELSHSIKDILTRTQEISDIASYIEESATQAKQLNELVEDHFEKIEARTNALTASSVVMEDHAKQSVNHFKEYIEEQITALKAVTLREDDLLMQAFEKNRDVLGNLKELTGIKEELEQIKADMVQLKDNSEILSAIRSNSNNIIGNRDTVQRLISSLERINSEWKDKRDKRRKLTKEQLNLEKKSNSKNKKVKTSKQSENRNIKVTNEAQASNYYDEGKEGGLGFKNAFKILVGRIKKPFK